MRKLFLSLVAATALTSQSATPNHVFEIGRSYFEIIPTFAAYNDEATLYLESESTDATCVYKLYTESFEEKGIVTFNGNVLGLAHYNTTNYFDDSSLYLTQTLFNDDADYEALIEVYDETTQRITGVKAVKGNTGEVVTTFELPSEINTTDLDGWLYLYTTSTGKYFCIYTDSHALVYNISSTESGSVKSPILIEAIKIRPAIVTQGEEINIEVSDNTEIESVTVTDMKGATRRITPDADNHSASINSGRLAKGMHIVGVETANGTQSSKVIVR